MVSPTFFAARVKHMRVPSSPYRYRCKELAKTLRAHYKDETEPPPQAASPLSESRITAPESGGEDVRPQTLPQTPGAPEVPPSRFGRRQPKPFRVGAAHARQAIAPAEGVGEAERLRQALHTQPIEYPTRPKEQRRANPKRSNVIAMQEGVDDWVHSEVADLLKSGMFTTDKSREEAENILQGQGKFSGDVHNVGDMVLNKVKRAYRAGLVSGQDFDEAVNDVIYTVIHDAFRKLRETGQSWDDYSQVTLAHRLEQIASKAVVRFIKQKRTRAERFPSVSLEQRREDEGRQGFDVAEPERADEDVKHANVQDVQNALRDIPGSPLTHLTHLVLPHIQPGKPRFTERLAQAAQTARDTEPDLDDEDRAALTRFAQPGFHLQRVMASFVGMMRALAAGDYANAEKIATGEMGKRHDFLSYYNAYVRKHPEEKKLKALRVPPSPYKGVWIKRFFRKGRLTGPSYTGTFTDSRQRRVCMRDGKHTPCQEFGGQGQNWQAQRGIEDLYDATRRLVDKVKAGDQAGWDELVSLLASTPAKQLHQLKREHSLNASPIIQGQLTQMVQEKLQAMGYTVGEQQPASVGG